MGATVIGNVSPQVQGYYEQRALLRAKKICLAYALGQKKTLPEGKGTTVNFYRYTPLLKNTTAMTEATDGGIGVSSRQNFLTQEVTCVPKIWSDFVPSSMLSTLERIDQNDSEQIDVVMQMAFESFDYLIHKKIAQNLTRRRADGDVNYQVVGTMTGTPSATTIADSTRTASDVNKPAIADQFYTGGYMTITNPTSPAYGQTRQITGYTNSTGSFTFTTGFSAVPNVGDSYRVVVGTNIGASSTINSRCLRLAGRDMARNKAQRFEKGMFKSIVDPDTYYDFMDDPNLVRAGTDKDRTDFLETNDVSRWAGVMFDQSTTVFQETAAGVEVDPDGGSTTGLVHVVPILGKEAFGVVNLGKLGSGKKNFEMYIRNWEQLGQPVPLYSTIGYQARFDSVMLNACFGVGILCGASDLI
jgi:hypothetical protein